jgi:hypothetical protein
MLRIYWLESSEAERWMRERMFYEGSADLDEESNCQFFLHQRLFIMIIAMIQ